MITRWFAKKIGGYTLSLREEGDGKCYSCHANGVRQLGPSHSPHFHAIQVRILWQYGLNTLIPYRWMNFLEACVLHRFFLSPASARPLAALRISVSVVVLIQVYLLIGTELDFLGTHGILQGDLAGFLSESGTPRISHFAGIFAPIGIDETLCIKSFCFLYVTGLLILLLGWRSQVSALFAWFFHWVLVSTAASTSYGVDLYAHVILFYLIWSPSGDVWSVDRLTSRESEKPSWRARLMLGVIQLHLCISCFCSAIEKARGPQWWNGELLWRALNLPEYRQFDFLWLAQWPSLARWAGLGSLMIEAGYFVFIWPRATRRIWVIGIVSMHLGIAIFLGLGVFGSIMACLTASVFGFSADPTIAQNKLISIDSERDKGFILAQFVHK